MRIFFLLLLLAAFTARAATTILIVNQDSPGEGLNDTTPVAPVGGNSGTNVGQQRLIVMQRAADLWAQRLVSSVPIRVGANFNPLSCSDFSGVLGSTGPSVFHRDFAGVPRAGTYYPAALANALARTDLSATSVDMDAEFNSNVGQAGCLSSYSWYYGLDGAAPGNSFDFLGVVLHEFAHGLGFLSTVDLATGAKFNGFNDPYIFNLEDHTTGKLYPNMTDAERLAASLNAGNLHWVGTNATNHAAHLASGRDPASGHLRMYAPATAEPGSSVGHWDTVFSPDELMEPFANPVTDRRLTEELFRDIGWTVLPPMQTNGLIILAESCPNGAIDPGETVTVSFGLKNAGFANVANITATLLATNGVNSPSGAQSFGALTNLGPGAARAFTFTASDACGAIISPTFHVQDGATDYGLVSFPLRLGAAREFTNATAISIPNSGAATPYPSSITVSNFPGLANGVTVRLSGLSHNNPDDLDVLLVGPGGQKVLLMSDCGGTPNLSGVTFTFSDDAPAALADSSQLASGTFRPSNYGTGEAFTAPAPAAPYVTNLAVFNGTDPNGVWQLFVMDDANPTSGSFAGGWTLILPQCCQPVADAAVSGAMNWDGTNLLVSLLVTNIGPAPASAVVLSNVLPAGVTVASLDSGAASCSETGGVVRCLWPSLAAGAASAVSFSLLPAQPGWFTNRIFLSAAEMDSDLSNNIASLSALAAGAGDFDSDGMPDLWEITHGTNPLVPDADADPDHDGLNNLQEYLAGTDPQDAASVLRIVTIGFEPGGGGTVALRFLAVSNLTYAVLATTNPAGGPWERVLDIPAAGGGIITITNLPAAEPARFFRVVTPAP